MSRAPFKSRIQMRFRNGDPAGIVFFGNVYPLAHDIYEEFVQHLGFEWKQWFKNGEWIVPIRHSSCEHLAPLLPSEAYEVEVTVERIGQSSFTAKYAFTKAGRTHSEVSLVHTFASAKTHTKIPIPSEVFDRLESYRRECLKAE